MPDGHASWVHFSELFCLGQVSWIVLVWFEGLACAVSERNSARNKWPRIPAERFGPLAMSVVMCAESLLRTSESCQELTVLSGSMRARLPHGVCKVAFKIERGRRERKEMLETLEKAMSATLSSCSRLFKNFLKYCFDQRQSAWGVDLEAFQDVWS